MQRDDDHDRLWVPAGPIRIVIGCTMMGGGVLLAVVTSHNWVRAIGLLAFVISPFVMLTPPAKGKS
jgi:hypothetical protein